MQLVIKATKLLQSIFVVFERSVMKYMVLPLFDNTEGAHAKCNVPMHLKSKNYRLQHEQKIHVKFEACETCKLE